MTRLKPQDGIAVVTGAGGGLGRALALGLAREGFEVVGLGRRAEALQETAAEAAEGRFHAWPLDVADPAAVDRAFEEIRAKHGPVALLINNAAVYPRRDILDESGTSFMQTVAVNLGGTVACTRAALEDMCETGRGRILNVATFADLNPLPASSAYSVSKGAARIWTRALIADLADRFPEIVIGDWMPGMLRTGMGVPDGLAPETAAAWGVELALRMDPALTGAVFEMDTEVLPPRGLKSKLKDTLLLRRRKPRRL
ncbi:SDR family oxidoreductase [Salipiger mucosus]|uniref:3-oxoacyl-[acyl-carrier protein] reductase n=1 Tax=Salipiger mucosus DSM 16094 TaxID=1123237 RepID=S9QLH0_9RHOB|nr:SDR family NAD(P)-dependent oxidoreductase [Salipiger mucosus]EPX82316.1 3-oxoacyl-[acyl-carrier protein] reductase [Salipiger mucosus DSM 16094]